MTERESALLERILDDRASAAEETEFGRRLKANPSLRASWVEQIHLHVLLQDNRGSIRGALGREAPDSSAGAFDRGLRRLAAALAVIFGTAFLLAFGIKLLIDEAPVPAPDPVPFSEPIPAKVPMPVPVSTTTQKNERITMPSTTSLIPRAAAITAAVAAVAATIAAPPAAVATEERAGNISAAFTLNADPDASRFWRTAETNEFTLAWDWPLGAVSATLRVTGAKADRSAVFSTAVSNTVLTLEYPVERKLENVYTLTMVFKDGNDEALPNGTLSATFGLVQGVNGRAFRFVGDPAEEAWARTTARNVLPVEAGALALTIDGKAIDTGLDGAAGWYLWSDAAIGTHSIAVTDSDSVTLTAAVNVITGGTLYIFQ